MTKAPSIDVRERVVAVIDGGVSRARRAAPVRGQCVKRNPLKALTRRKGRRASDRATIGVRGRIKAHAYMILGAVAT